MKKIEAYIRHEAFEPIREELLQLGFPSLSKMKSPGPMRPTELRSGERRCSHSMYRSPFGEKAMPSPKLLADASLGRSTSPSGPTNFALRGTGLRSRSIRLRKWTPQKLMFWFFFEVMYRT